MTTKKIYGPWIKWHGGECPVPPDTLVEVKLRCGHICYGPRRAGDYFWKHEYGATDIFSYQVAIEQSDLEAAEQLLRANDYTVTLPAKPLTFEDVTPMTEAPPEGTEYWYLEATNAEGVSSFVWRDDGLDEIVLKRRVAYLDKEHALIAARHIFGLKGGEL